MSNFVKFLFIVSIITNVVLGILYTKEYTEYSTYKTYAPYMYKTGVIDAPSILPELEIK